MTEESFKERVRQEMIKAAKQYKDIYVDYEYLTQTSHNIFGRKPLKNKGI